MRSNGPIIEAVRLVPGSSNRGGQNGEASVVPSRIAEVAVRVLGTMLVLYKHYVPNSEYYKVHDTVAQ